MNSPALGSFFHLKHMYSQFTKRGGEAASALATSNTPQPTPWKQARPLEPEVTGIIEKRVCFGTLPSLPASLSRSRVGAGAPHFEGEGAPHCTRDRRISAGRPASFRCGNSHYRERRLHRPQPRPVVGRSAPRRENGERHARLRLDRTAPLALLATDWLHECDKCIRV